MTGSDSERAGEDLPSPSGVKCLVQICPLSSPCMRMSSRLLGPARPLGDKERLAGVWDCGRVELWTRGVAGVWSYGHVELRACGIVGVWSYGRVEL